MKLVLFFSLFAIFWCSTLADHSTKCTSVNDQDGSIKEISADVSDRENEENQDDDLNTSGDDEDGETVSDLDDENSEESPDKNSSNVDSETNSGETEATTDETVNPDETQSETSTEAVENHENDSEETTASEKTIVDEQTEDSGSTSNEKSGDKTTIEATLIRALTKLESIKDTVGEVIRDLKSTKAAEVSSSSESRRRPPRFTGGRKRGVALRALKPHRLAAKKPRETKRAKAMYKKRYHFASAADTQDL